MSDATAQRPDKGMGGDLGIRSLSAIVLIPPVLAALYLGSPYFEILVAAGTLIIAWEWFGLCGKRPAWLVGGGLYIALACCALVLIRTDPQGGRETTIWLFAVVWATDIGAYAVGRTVGGPKLWPAISPKKTWSGLIGGAFAAGVVGAATTMVLAGGNIFHLAGLSAMFGVLSQAGDLLESWVKRRFGKKDAGNLIPGHGGLLDRVDGLLAAALGVLVAGKVTGQGSILAWM